MNDFEDENEAGSDSAVEFELPPKYKVVLLNDDFTTKDFVVYVLVDIFKKSELDAERIMESVHRSGKGVAGVYPYDIAATKARMTMDKARGNGFPLKCVLEKE
jgi:ATP-dependent Clp protease adaptor protein ClpS